MLDRKQKNRFRLKSLSSKDRLRLCVFRSCKHVSAQIIDANGNVLKEVSSSLKSCPVFSSTKMEKSKWVGQEIARLSDAKDLFYFDRGKYAYHGVVKALAEAAREAGMRF